MTQFLSQKVQLLYIISEIYNPLSRVVCTSEASYTILVISWCMTQRLYALRAENCWQIELGHEMRNDCVNIVV
jgi:hypothetical protein